MPQYDPVNIDDVRAILGEQDPHSTNAGKIRAELGRGSLSTIQKHLDTLRIQLLREQEAPSQDALPLPPAPQDVLASLWSTAFEAARGRVAQHLASLSERFSAVQLTVSAQAQDKALLSSEIESLEAALKAASDSSSATAKATSDMAAAAEQAASTLHEKIAFLEADCARLMTEKTSALHDAEIRMRTLQQVVDRAGERTAELRSELEHERHRNEELVGKLEALARRPSQEPGAFLSQPLAQ